MTGDGVAIDKLGRAWLAAATEGGLPEPARSRWQPLRVGIVNLWEYDDTEFWFADGRLVLRGGNGTGKTKVLELTTLMLLRGEVAPSVLDPFGSQHRTMRFNLLPTGEGDDPRESADSGLGYAWVEFGRRDEAGESRFLTCGMGASARRGTGTGGVSVWHFLTESRPGKDFSLLSDGRAIEQKDLKRIDGVSVPVTAEAYRERLAAELFGMPIESYRNLTDLLKQLRRPKLGERLNPNSLAETLREALPPLASHEITQLAEGWEHLEQLRDAVQATERAATEVARFVRDGWRPWARVVLRRRADEFAAATTGLDNTTRDKNRAAVALEEATGQVGEAEIQLGTSTQDRDSRAVELRELLVSDAYRDAVAAAGRVDTLRKAVEELRGRLGDTANRLSGERSRVADAERKAVEARGKVTGAEQQVGKAGVALAEIAPATGLVEAVDRHLPERDLDALSGAYGTRRERFAQLRRLHDEHGKADRVADQSGQDARRAEQSLVAATAEESEARQLVETRVEAFRQRIRDWAEAVEVASCPRELAREWSDRVADLTNIDVEAGTVEPAASVAEAMRAHVATVRDTLTSLAAEVLSSREPLVSERGEVESALNEVRQRAETPPPEPASWARRHRPDLDAGQGAPLWRLANPVDGLDGDRLALLEAGLAASGLLDAWVNPDGVLSTIDGVLIADVQPLPGTPAAARSLLAVLAPDSAGGVDGAVVSQLLGGIGWYDTAPSSASGDWLAADGSWRVGGITGRAEPAAPASYLGAAAREQARRREIVRLEGEIAALDTKIATLDDQLAEIGREREKLDGEERAIPAVTESALREEVARWADRARRRAARTTALGEEQEKHEKDVAQRDTAWGRFAEYAGSHRFGLHDMEGQDAALREFQERLAALAGELRLLEVFTSAREAAEETLEQWARVTQATRDEIETLEGMLRQETVRLTTAENALGADQAALLDRRDALDTEVERLGAAIDHLTGVLTEAKVAQARAEEVLEQHEKRRAEAEQVRDTAMSALWATLDAGLAEPLELALPDRRNVQSARGFAATARQQLSVSALPGDEDRAWRRCYKLMEGLRQELLPDRDARVEEDADDGAGLPSVLVLADSLAGWQLPHQAAQALTARVSEQREKYDAEQQRVLSTLLESTFIEHLKDRLDDAQHTFARINDQLAKHPTRQGHVVRVLTEADPNDPDANAVVTTLGVEYSLLSAERQEMVRSFLARKINEVRDGAEAAGAVDWKEHLAQALDYRRWLKLSLQYRPGSGSPWKVFDAAKHAAKSGGEKVVLLSQPLFAAAVVSYDAAGPLAPRWVWLDEAMTGVDAAVKASFMGLTVDFELDVMLTAHDEWCTYPTVPAVAVYDLARQAQQPGVDVLPYLWCGGERTMVDVARIGVTPPAPPLPSDGLFADLDPDGDGD
ncbi:MAG: TIGR02680 family protein [Mycobacteriales bacterium]